MLVKSDHFPRDRGENKKYLSCHHLVFDLKQKNRLTSVCQILQNRKIAAFDFFSGKNGGKPNFGGDSSERGSFKSPQICQKKTFKKPNSSVPSKMLLRNQDFFWSPFKNYLLGPFGY